MLSEKMLLEIKAKYTHYGDTEKLHPNTAVLDVRRLLDEVDRLKAELLEALTMYYQSNLDKD